MSSQFRASQPGFLWALLGGAWGGWVGFRGYYQILPHMNGDTAAPVFVWGMFAGVALIGLVVGASLALVVGLGVDWLMQRLRADRAVATGVGSLAVVLVLWLATQAAGQLYPGLRAQQAQPPPAVRTPVVPATDRPLPDPCAGTPPRDPRERESRDLECR
jgi:hypothetical protein